jgi:hypothetical protein
LAITQTEFGIAGEGSGESTAGFGRGQVEPRAIEQPFRQQSSRCGKAEQFEVVAVGDLERLCCIRKRQVTGRTDLFVTALRGTPQPFELEVDKAKIVRAQGDVRSEAKHGVPGGGDQRYLDRSGINPRNCAFKGLVSDPAWLKPYEGSRKVVSPTSKGLIRTSRLCRPFHEHPKQIAIAKGTPAVKTYRWRRRRSTRYLRGPAWQFAKQTHLQRLYVFPPRSWFGSFPKAISSTSEACSPGYTTTSIKSIPDQYRGQSPKAYLALKPGAPELSLKELKDFLKSRLGKHEMISEMEIRAALPRTPVGKLSKKKRSCTMRSMQSRRPRKLHYRAAMPSILV